MQIEKFPGFKQLWNAIGKAFSSFTQSGSDTPWWKSSFGFGMHAMSTPHGALGPTVFMMQGTAGVTGGQLPRRRSPAADALALDLGTLSVADCEAILHSTTPVRITKTHPVRRLTQDVTAGASTADVILHRLAPLRELLEDVDADVTARAQCVWAILSSSQQCAIAHDGLRAALQQVAAATTGDTAARITGYLAAAEARTTVQSMAAPAAAPAAVAAAAPPPLPADIATAAAAVATPGTSTAIVLASAPANQAATRAGWLAHVTAAHAAREAARLRPATATIEDIARILSSASGLDADAAYIRQLIIQLPANDTERTDRAAVKHTILTAVAQGLDNTPAWDVVTYLTDDTHATDGTHNIAIHCAGLANNLGILAQNYVANSARTSLDDIAFIFRKTQSSQRTSAGLKWSVNRLVDCFVARQFTTLDLQAIQNSTLPQALRKKIVGAYATLCSEPPPADEVIERVGHGIPLGTVVHGDPDGMRVGSTAIAGEDVPRRLPNPADVLYICPPYLPFRHDPIPGVQMPPAEPATAASHGTSTALVLASSPAGQLVTPAGYHAAMADAVERHTARQSLVAALHARQVTLGTQLVEAGVTAAMHTHEAEAAAPTFLRPRFGLDVGAAVARELAALDAAHEAMHVPAHPVEIVPAPHAAPTPPVAPAVPTVAAPSPAPQHTSVDPALLRSIFAVRSPRTLLPAIAAARDNNTSFALRTGETRELANAVLAGNAHADSCMEALFAIAGDPAHLQSDHSASIIADILVELWMRPTVGEAAHDLLTSASRVPAVLRHVFAKQSELHATHQRICTALPAEGFATLLRDCPQSVAALCHPMSRSTDAHRQIVMRTFDIASSSPMDATLRSHAQRIMIALAGNETAEQIQARDLLLGLGRTNIDAGHDLQALYMVPFGTPVHVTPPAIPDLVAQYAQGTRKSARARNELARAFINAVTRQDLHAATATVTTLLALHHAVPANTLAQSVTAQLPRQQIHETKKVLDALKLSASDPAHFFKLLLAAAPRSDSPQRIAWGIRTRLIDVHMISADDSDAHTALRDFLTLCATIEQPAELTALDRVVVVRAAREFAKKSDAWIRAQPQLASLRSKSNLSESLRALGAAVQSSNADAMRTAIAAAQKVLTTSATRSA